MTESGATRHHMPFQTWMEHVDQELIRTIGFPSECLADTAGADKWNMFNDGVTVKEAASRIIDEEFAS